MKLEKAFGITALSSFLCINICICYQETPGRTKVKGHLAVSRVELQGTVLLGEGEDDSILMRLL